MMKEVGGIAEAGMDEAMGEIASDAPQVLPLIQKLFGGSMAALEHLTELAIVNLLCSAIALFGVIKMWQLKKYGFYLFVGGKVVIIITPMILIGGLVGSMTLFGAIFPIAFIVMYAVNLKAME
ncbi:MAG: hypothetical protein JXA77_16060 [Bacteroidales bacterium]|nr:hypothetical protein [Bacteroidales bacterium]MBN2821100.1 hypothetical protein [Bacteroidales bacterium]